ncbi:hypothetical protein [Actinopolymorpha pittospori]|uniref:Uncharacterized protein n=1 Tax=Actinopolymorpha pittospori TaxID=648752 RepID=A0A927RA57_9ACTN|nr:hypothetical protein [Actinopolymorpha pittospori]MBE1604680.1 hypothetical protein [Actinopolymorpha pittospori]
MPDPVQVSSKSLIKTAVDMDADVEQLAELRKLLGGDCQLPALALGGVGIFACGRYNGGCDDIDTKMNALRTEGVTIANGMGKAAVGYVSAEVANLLTIVQAAGSAHSDSVPRGGRVGEGVSNGLLSASLLARWGLGNAQQQKLAEAAAHARSVTVEADYAIEVATRVWREMADTEAMKMSLSAEEALLLESRYNDFANGRLDRALLETIQDHFGAERRVSQLRALSLRTDAVLKMSSRFNIAATVASVLWTAEALVMSDDLIDKAIGSWYGVAAGARTIFHDWMPAIRQSMVPDWTGEASTAAQRRLAAFISDGTALADRAEHMGASLQTVVERLNIMHSAVFAFSMTQFIAMLALSALAWVNPGAALLLQYFGWLLNVWITVGVNVMLAVVGSLVAWASA